MSDSPSSSAPVPAASSQAPLVSVSGLTKYYREFCAVKDVSFSLQRGEVVGFLGPNGAGKSTTMRMIAGAIPATFGKVNVCGFDVFEKPIEVKKRVGYLPEIPPVYPDLTVKDQLLFGASLKGLSKQEAKVSIERSVERCQLEPVYHRLVGQCSKGFRQRVGLGQALLGNPEVLILDEPTVGLDPSQIQEVRALVQELSQEHTIILSTHILQEVSLVCKRVVLIRFGELILDDTLENLRKSEGDKSIEQIFLERVGA
ncbi:MAG: ABC transporter ATP-binding protein [Deltaproteobacteria bacterium]|nr:ABC transporter ATP-binding protein [Deltaproteobacteria bacterium]